MRAQTVNISLPKPLIYQVDALARQVFATRSDLIRQALVEKLRRWNAWENIFAYGERRARKLEIKTEDQVNRLVGEIRHGKRSA